MLGTIDLEILHLAASTGGRIDESGLENSSLRRLGVGKILDALASLRDRDLIKLCEKDGGFLITEAARNILWTNDIPLWTRILRLLEIRSCTTAEIAIMLLLHNDRKVELCNTLDRLQREGFVMMEPQIRDKKVQKVYEILSEGARAAESFDKNGSKAGMGMPTKSAPSPLNAIDEIEKMITSSPTITSDERRAILQKLSGLREMTEFQHRDNK